MDLTYVSKSSAKRLYDTFRHSGLIDTTLSHEMVDNGIILPFVIGGLFDAMGGVEREDGTFVKSSVFDWRMHGDYEYNNVISSTDKVIFISFIHKCWGHVITDAIKRLWFIHTHEYAKLKSEGYRLAYISYPDIRKDEYSYIHRVFQLCGADLNDMIYVNQPTRFAQVVVPDCSYIQYADYDNCTKEFVGLIERMKSNIKIEDIPSPYEKIYLTRTKIKSEKDFGEAAVEQLFREKGYEIISPETLSVDSQISIMMKAKHIVATEGSIAHTMMFANRQCKCTVLRKADYINKYQILIAKVFLKNFTYIDANHSVYSRGSRKEDGPFYISPTKHLMNFLGLHICYRPAILSPGFWAYFIKQNPILRHICNMCIFITSPISVKREIIFNKLHFLKYR